MVKRRTKFSLLTEQEDAFQRPLFSAEESDPTTSTPDDLASTALLWLECQPLPHAMLSKELSILWVNAKARAVLAEKRDVQSRNETFTTVDPLHQQDLHNFLINSTSSLTSWSMRRSDGDGRVIFRAQKFEKTPSSIIAVTFFGSGSDFQPAYVDLERTFRLTRAQHGVLMDLLGGRDVDAIAQLRKVSVETVRTHIRVIYSKLGVNSREALFHTLQPFRL